MPDGLYEADFFLWTQEQARPLRDGARAGTNLPIDWERLAEEIDSVRRGQRRELAGRTTVLVEHLLKLQFSLAAAPRRRWIATVRTQRREIALLLDLNPSLHALVGSDARAAVAWVAADIASMLGDRDELAAGAASAIPSAAYTEAELLGDWLPDPPAG